MLDNLLVLNNTVGIGSLCKIEPSNVIFLLGENNPDSNLILSSKVKDKYIKIANKIDDPKEQEQSAGFEDEDAQDEDAEDEDVEDEDENMKRNVRSVSTSLHNSTGKSTNIDIQRLDDLLLFCA